MKPRIISISIVMICTISFASAYFNYLPGFEGRILDRISNKPVTNAYIICFTDFAPFYAHSHHPESFEITTTDKNGHFKVNPYIKFSLGSIANRQIYIFGENYLYPLRYNQNLGRNEFISANTVSYNPNSEFNINYKLDLYLDNKEQVVKDGYAEEIISSSYSELLGQVAYRYDDFKSAKIRNFENNLLHLLVKKNSDIISTLKMPEEKQQWERDLKEFKYKVEKK